jgi:hypothetical protein
VLKMVSRRLGARPGFVVGIVAVLVCILGACVSNAATDPTASDLKLGLEAFRAAHLVRIDGQVADAGRRYHIDMSFVSTATTGTLNAEGDVISFYSNQDGTFMSSSALVARVKPSAVASVRDHWFKAPQTPETQLVAKLIDRGALTAAIGQSGKFKETTDGLNGQSVKKLTDATEVVYLSIDSPHRLLRVETVAGVRLADGLSDLALDVVSYDEPAKVPTPSVIINLDDASTYPPYYVSVAQSFAFGNCDSSQCPMSAKGTNQGGRQGQLSTATFTIRQPGGDSVGDCSVDIPLVDNGQVTSFGCTVGGAAYAAIAGSGFFGSAQIKNAP